MPSWLRPSAETMPIVTVCPTPKGLPIASTTSPTARLSVAEKVIAGSTASLAMRSTARSVSGSRPISFAANLRPSLSAISIASAVSMTWLLVST